MAAGPGLLRTVGQEGNAGRARSVVGRVRSARVLTRTVIEYER